MRKIESQLENCDFSLAILRSFEKNIFIIFNKTFNEFS